MFPAGLSSWCCETATYRFQSPLVTARPHYLPHPPHPAPPQVISSPSRLAARDAPYVTDFGDPFAPAMAPQVSPGRTGRRVTFATDTLFRCG